MTVSNESTHHRNKDSASPFYKPNFWTREGLCDDLFLKLCTTWVTVTGAEGREIKVSKYYMRAYELVPAISAGEPPPYFDINLSDLPPTLIDGLRNEQKNDRDYIILRAIGRIFENISPRIYHLSIARRLRWRLVP